MIYFAFLEKNTDTRSNDDNQTLWIDADVHGKCFCLHDTYFDAIYLKKT